MISKIIALIIALVFIIASPLYGAIVTPENPVSFGAGGGKSELINTPEELNEVIKKIPALETYLTNDSVLEVDPEFKPFTMVESGSSTKTNTGYFYQESERLCRVKKSINDHVLEMCFGTDALYYHVVGEMIEEELVYGTYDGSTGYNGSDFREGERTRRTFDIEIYYSHEQTLIKYNDFDIYNEEVVSYDADRGRPTYQAKTDVQDSETMIMNKVMEAMEACFGIWMSPETISDEEYVQKMEGLSEEEAAIEMLTIEFVNTLSSAWVDEIANANSGNTQYLVGLSKFIVALDDYFWSESNYFVFDASEENQKEYFGTFGVSTTYYTSHTLNARLTFNGEQAMVNQEWYLSTVNSSEVIELKTLTKIKNLGNTVCSVGDDAKIDTAYNVFGAALRGVFQELVAEMEGNN